MDTITLIGVTVIGGFAVLVFVRVTWYGWRSTGFSVPSLGRGRCFGGHTPGDAIEEARIVIEDQTEAS